MYSVRSFLLAAAVVLGASTPAQVRFHDEVFPVQLQSGVLYGTGATGFSGTPGVKNLTADVYTPVGFPAPTRPALLLVHGGSFSSGNSTSPDMVQAAQYFAARGWVCVSINYRLQGDDPPAPSWVALFGGLAGRAGHAAAVDTKRALRWMRANAASLGIDPNAIGGIGHSAGAFCVLMASVTDPEDFANDAGTPVPDQNPSQSGELNACVEVSGDIALWGGDVDANDAPLMIVHGTADTTVPFTAAEAIRDLCVAAPLEHEFWSLPGINHGAPTWLADFDGKPLLERCRNFFNHHFLLYTQITAEPVPVGVELSWTGRTNRTYAVHASATPAFSSPVVLIPATMATSIVTRVAVTPPEDRPYLRIEFSGP